MKFAFFLVTLFLLNLSFASEQTVQVQGSCQIKVVPDRGMISFTAENQSKDQKDAVKKTNDQINLLKSKITALKIDKMVFKNTNYSVYPVREYEKDNYVDKGTKATLTLEVTTPDISRLGETLVAASEVGIQNVGSLQTFLSLEKSQAEYLKCLDVASDDAKEKAKQLARRLGFSLGAVTQVIETPTLQVPPQPVYLASSMMTKGASRGTTIEAGEQQFSTTIQVSFKIK